MFLSGFPSPSGTVFDPRSTDAVLPLSLLHQGVTNLENMTSHVMPPRSVSEPSLVSEPNASSVSVMPPPSMSDPSLLNVTSASVSVMPPRSVSDPSLLNVTSSSVSAPSLVRSLSTGVTGLVDEPLTTRSAALSRSLGMFLAGRRNSGVGTQARQPLRRSLEAMHSFRAARNSSKQVFWDKAPKEVLQRPVVKARPAAIVPPVPKTGFMWPDEPEHEHVTSDGSLKSCPVCLAALEGRASLPNAEASVEDAPEEKDPLRVEWENSIDWELKNFATALHDLFDVIFGDESGEASRRLWLILHMYNPCDAEKAEAKAILQLLLGLPSAPEIDFPDRSSYVEQLFGPETARRLDFAGDPVIARLATISEALTGTITIGMEDSEKESENQQFTQFTLQEYDPNAPEESLGQFSQMYYNTFRQVDSEDEDFDPEDAPQRGALIVRNL